MEIFNYHPATGEFLSIGVADENPLNAEEPIIASYATPAEPPASQVGRARVYRRLDGSAPQNWQEGSWTLVPDYRAAQLYRTDTGAPFELGDEYGGLGDLPAFLTDEPRPSSAHVWSNDEWTLDEALETVQLGATALAQRDALLVAADHMIAPLMDGFVLGELTAEDELALKALSQYRKALRALPGQSGWPREITWPPTPTGFVAAAT